MNPDHQKQREEIAEPFTCGEIGGLFAIWWDGGNYVWGFDLTQRNVVEGLCRQLNKRALDLDQLRQSEIEELRKNLELYAAAARVIALYLKDFCDESLPYDEMISDAARRAGEIIHNTKEELARVKGFIDDGIPEAMELDEHYVWASQELTRRQAFEKADICRIIGDLRRQLIKARHPVKHL